MFRGGQQAALARGTTQRFRGTGVNAQGRIERPSGNEDAEEETDEEEGRERIGFDRLRSVSCVDMFACSFQLPHVSISFITIS